MDVCSYWVDVAMQISGKDLRLMDRLVRAQDKKAAMGYGLETERHIA
jgi:hypothetical protein